MSVLRPISFLGTRQSRGGLFIFIIFLIGLALGVAGGYHLKGYLSQTLEGQPGALAQLAPAGAVPGVSGSAAALPPPAGPAAQPGAVPGALPPPAAQPGAPAAPRAPEWTTLDAPVRGSLAETLAKNVDGRLADVLSAELGRVLVWWVDLTKDVLKNDRVQMVYKPSDNPTERHVSALRYTSRKNGKTYAAYLYKPQKAQYPRFYDENGQEVERRLSKSPIAQYEQITTVLDLTGRPHHGVDFKTDVGTPVTTPYRAKVVRFNWHTGRNGYCLEILFPESGMKALFLHLDEVLPAAKKVDAILEAGTEVARSGNTGHSTAPHLHYELHDSSDRVLNPLKVHETFQLKLEGDDLKRFIEERDRAERLMTSPAAPAPGSSPAPSASIPATATPAGTAHTP